MRKLRPLHLRSIRPPYRIRPRSAVTLMPDDEQSTPGIVERLRRFARQMLSPVAS